jgi:hypothetical protein
VKGWGLRASLASATSLLALLLIEARGAVADPIIRVGETSPFYYVLGAGWDAGADLSGPARPTDSYLFTPLSTGVTESPSGSAGSNSYFQFDQLALMKLASINTSGGDLPSVRPAAYLSGAARSGNSVFVGTSDGLALRVGVSGGGSASFGYTVPSRADGDTPASQATSPAGDGTGPANVDAWPPVGATGAISGPPVADGAVSGPPIAGWAVSGPPIAGGAVSGPPVAGGTISGPPVAGGAMSGPPVAGGAVSGPPVAGGAGAAPRDGISGTASGRDVDAVSARPAAAVTPGYLYTPLRNVTSISPEFARSGDDGASSTAARSGSTGPAVANRAQPGAVKGGSAGPVVVASARDTRGIAVTRSAGGAVPGAGPLAAVPLAAVTAGAVAAGAVAAGAVQDEAIKGFYRTLQRTAAGADHIEPTMENLTVDGYRTAAADPTLFSVSSVSAGTVVPRNLTVPVPILVVGSGAGELASSLTIFTAEAAALSGAGDGFNFFFDRGVVQ